MTLAEQGEALRSARCSSREIVEAHLDRIDRLNGKLSAYVEVYRDEARQLADAADRARAAGMPLGPLHGLPIGIKDLCDIAGRVGTIGSKMWSGRRADTTSATVERLLAAGMIPLGKLHMVEFAFGGWGTNPLMGTPWNPWDPKRHRVPGGSSSGTAVAVAAGLAPAGIGSDTGGSVRIPSGFNGLVGLKVTYGRISLHGTGLLSWTLDSIGPLCRSVEDCAQLLRVLAGPDPRDPATLSQPPLELPDALRVDSLAGVRIALPDAGQLPDFMHPAAVAAWTDAARQLEKLGADVVPARLPEWYFELSKAAGTIIAAECYSMVRDRVEDPSQAIGDAVRARVLGARQQKPGEYAETLRMMGQKRAEFAEWFRRYDAVLLPTMAVPAPPVDEIDEFSPLPGYLTRPANYLGLCGLSMPAGLHDGLPLGVQIVGKPFAERTILEIGKAYQDATGFHRLRPPSHESG
ncbi:amidase [Burkholderiaceae bacterium FT117]|uniref:amidase n=1 Tax=Zeimonas sediminis TaxID=2944268 RepID=UPI002342FF5F|nr:amidase [Zeimonas sediminis]MCM5571224.1 amidase [Zeimonas sediminis]